MRLTTIFEAYRQAELMKGVTERNRSRRNFGIAVDTDENALYWQRLDRQSRTFERRLRDDMDGIESGISE
jgi:hypothetical protein